MNTTYEYNVLSKVWAEFDQWADGLIKDYMIMPKYNEVVTTRHKANIETLQSAKINLQRIIKNYVEG